MSFYRLLQGESPSADQLLAALGLARGDFYRYRDAYLTPDGEIAVYTRGGGNNRECLCDGDEAAETVEVNGERHEPWCVVPLQHRLRQHPAYLRDEDDDFDSTYCTFYFRAPEGARLDGVEAEVRGAAGWSEVLRRLQS